MKNIIIIHKFTYLYKMFKIKIKYDFYKEHYIFSNFDINYFLNDILLYANKKKK